MSLDAARALKLAPRPVADRRAHSEVVVARRYLEHGFLDAALRIFGRHVALVAPQDWSRLVERLLERGRVTDSIAVCQTGGIPLPRERLLALGDRDLQRKDVHGAVRYYELAEADQTRWSALVDVLTRLPGHELHAMEVVRRHLVPTDAAAAPITLAVSA
jgi:hypothetical protein